MAKRGRKREAKVEAVTPGRLKSFVERIVRLMEEREEIGGDITDVFSEAKGIGYDAATMRKVIRIFRMDAADRAAEAEQLALYMDALGLVDRVQNRIAAGETLDGVAKAEGITKSRAQRIVSKTRERSESEQIDPTTGVIPTPGATETPGAASTDSETPVLAVPGGGDKGTSGTEAGLAPVAANHESCGGEQPAIDGRREASGGMGRNGSAVLIHNQTVDHEKPRPDDTIPDDVALERMEEAGAVWREGLRRARP